ncbi:MAG: energy-coupling factor transporter ATPase [Peptococcaceae bacterium]|jgi:energy-coupling factor transport system ATP-binding protein|nr:energy-coupling factor transporter ATPase [Peptococcaceae bacterium]MBQ2120280.1 energy-coupling factor transporter ATPase [Peptococcaceae bacterium]MBQ2448918.1 energy-coupling factor transporter ATPase [Peptococcaceae bacterium]MBQ5682596.1 energy-coupling factor transporter ATPase [Peptococcaceae bacterium]MBQ5702673.1 energy-coupling factor transporter ATPase [Peptococcaceae bacterium]
MIRIQRVTHIYKKESTKQEVKALDNVSLDIREGEHIAVLGHNGCGKSTLAKHLNALLLPTAGTVEVDAVDTANEADLWTIRQMVGMVFQNPDNQLVATTVEEDVAFGPENMGMEPALIRQRVDEALALVGMSQFKDKGPHLLSGGQKQRVAIAGIIAMRPKYIVFDEPTAMLDPIGRKEVMDTMQRLNREEGITVINITHFMEEAVLADRVVVMDHGRIVLSGTPKEVFTQVDFLKQMQLDVPPIAELAALLHKEDTHIAADIMTIEEMVRELCP